MAMDFSDFSYKEGSFLVTGSAGFSGFHLARELLARGARACSWGAETLLLPLMALQVGPGDAVFTAPFTFIAGDGYQ